MQWKTILFLRAFPFISSLGHGAACSIYCTKYELLVRFVSCVDKQDYISGRYKLGERNFSEN